MTAARVLTALAVLCVAAGAAPVLRQAPRTPNRLGGQRAAAATSASRTWDGLLEQMAAEVRTGASLAAAHQAATGRALVHGHPAPAPADDDEALALQAIDSARALGGPVAATLDAAADTIRERARLRHEARAHSAPARLSATMLTAVPLVFCAWNLLTSASFRAAWCSRIGLVAAAAGALCNLTGWWWMRHIITKAAP